MAFEALPPALIDPDRARTLMGPAAEGVSFLFLKETGSTNDVARDYLLKAGPAARPALISAEAQRAGRGRMGRRWESPASVNLLVTLALPQSFVGPLRAEIAGIAAAEMVCREIESEEPRLRPTIKWPNDVELGELKVAGVLSEAVSPLGLIVGIGLNVNLEAADFPEELRGRATSLRAATGRIWAREPLIAGLGRRILEWARMNEPGRTEAARGAWRARCAMEGRWLRVRQGETFLEGRVAGLDERGALLLVTADGATRRLLSGEVTLRV